jgi:preprotein translocase subunit SecG
MNLLLNLVVAVQIIAALVMIGLVLIQHGKGADMGASFGSGASGSLFGATGSANFMSRSTAVCAAVFFACTLALAYFSNERPRESTGSVLDKPNVSAPAAASGPLTGAAQVPSAQLPASQAAASGTAPSSSSAAAVAAPAATASGAGAVPSK